MVNISKVCLVCGETRYVEKAHILPRIMGGAGYPFNILLLCPTHHKLFDHNKLNDKEQGIIDKELIERFGRGDFWDCSTFNEKGMKGCKEKESVCIEFSPKGPYCKKLIQALKNDSRQYKYAKKKNLSGKIRLFMYAKECGQMSKVCKKIIKQYEKKQGEKEKV